jgi:uncharacterized protein (DUF2141 family)
MSLLAAVALVEATGSITVEVGNVRNARGHVVVDVCQQDKFLGGSCPYHGEAPARPGTTTVVVPHVPPGTFAAQAFHDENDNGETDRGLFGIPKEGIGFSRNARIRLGPPKWRDAAFAHQARPQVLRFDLRYFTGARGPAARGR